jgi:hypothetical protein
MPTTILGGPGKAEAWVTKKQNPRTVANNTIIKACFFIFCLLFDAIAFVLLVFISIPALIGLALYTQQFSCQCLYDRLDFNLNC